MATLPPFGRLLCDLDTSSLLPVLTHHPTLLLAIINCEAHYWSTPASCHPPAARPLQCVLQRRPVAIGYWGSLMTTATQAGFCGSLTTVSTFVAEVGAWACAT